MNAPRQGRGEILQPLPGCVSLIHFYQGFAKNAHPWLSSFRPAGAEFVTVIHEQEYLANFCRETSPEGAAGRLYDVAILVLVAAKGRLFAKIFSREASWVETILRIRS